MVTQYDTVTHSQQSVSGSEASILLCSAPLNDLRHKDAVVSRNVLVANAPSDAEPKTCSTQLTQLKGNQSHRFGHTHL